jgi:hypothetical protein
MRNKQFITFNKVFQFNVTYVVDLHVVGMYFKVRLDGRERNLQLVLLLECDENYKSIDW